MRHQVLLLFTAASLALSGYAATPTGAKPLDTSTMTEFSVVDFDGTPIYDGRGYTGTQRAAMALFPTSVLDGYPAHPELIGKYIKGVKVFDQIEGVDNYKIFVVSATDGALRDPDAKCRYILESPMTVTNGKGVAYFDTPLQIKEDSHYFVGYQFDIPTTSGEIAPEAFSKPFPFYPAPVHSLADKMYTPQWTAYWVAQGWDGYMGHTDEYGHAMVVLLDTEGGSPEDDNVIKATAQKPLALSTYCTGDSIKILVPVVNKSIRVINDIDYSFTVNGVTVTGHKTFMPAIEPAFTQDVAITVPPFEVGGKYPLTFTVVKANGLDNVHPTPGVTFDIDVVKPNDAIPEDAYEATYFGGGHVGYCNILEDWPDQNDVAIKYVDPNLKNMQIIGAKVSHLDPKNLKNFQIWESPTLGVSPAGQTVPAYIRADSTISAVFPQPVDLTAQGRFIGCYFENTDSHNDYLKCPYGTTWHHHLGFCIQAARNGKWMDLSSMGCAPITVYLKGNLKPNSIKVNKVLNKALTVPGEPVKVNLEVLNLGGNQINSLSYSYPVNGQEVHHTLVLDQPIKKTLTLPQNLTLSLPGFNVPGSQSIVVKIDSINGMVNEGRTKTVPLDVSVAYFRPTHRPLFEEGTGTTCGYCPRGMLALHLLAEQYPEFIAAAYHRYDEKDPMWAPVELPWVTAGFPCSNIDRDGDEFDPYKGSSDTGMGIRKDYEKALSYLAPANLDLETSWNETKDSIQIKGSAHFAFVEPNQTYSLGYIVIEDGLSNPDDIEWEQSNYYQGDANYANDHYLSCLVDGSFDLSVYNHVVISADTYKGIPNSITSPEPNGIYTNDYGISLKGNPVFTDPENVKVILVLLDKDGTVRNARMVKVGENTVPDPVEVVSISETAMGQTAKAQYFDLTGRTVAHPSHGIFIKKEGNKVTKILL